MTKHHFWSLHGAAVAAFSAALLLAFAGEARAQAATGPQGLHAVGPVDTLTGYPMWYQDKAGLKLGLCTNSDHCFFLPPNPAVVARPPASATDTTFNWPDESFFYACEAGLDGVNGTRGVLIHAVEAAYATGNVQRGQEIVFVRFRLHFWNFQPFQNYTFTFPFGQETHMADGDGRIFVTRDIGIGAPGKFDTALGGEIGPFLLPVGLIDPATGQPDPAKLQPGMFLTHNLVETEVVGSPNGTNYFSIEGPGIDVMFPDLVDLTDAQTDYVRTNFFTVQGMVANRHGVEHEKSYYSRSADMTSIDVFAQSSPGQDLYVELESGLRMRMDERPNGPGAYHAKIDLGQGAPVPAQVVLVNALDIPASTKLVSGFNPLIAITNANYSLGGSLVVQAKSSDLLGTSPIAVQGNGLPANTVLDWVQPGVYALSVANLTVPPNAVSIGSAQLRHSAGVVVNGANDDAGIPHPATANAGPDLHVTTGDLVTLDGSASTGTDLTFEWIQLTGTPVVLTVDAANPAIVTFTAPPVTNGADTGVEILSFRLVVNGIFGDTMLVNVVDPAAVPADDVRIERALYDVARRQWRIFGRTTVAQGQRVYLYLGTIDPAADPATWDRSRPIATVFPDGGADWNYEPGRLTAAGTAIPDAADTFIWAESELPGAPDTVAFRRR